MYYKNNKYLKKWCEKQTGTRYDNQTDNTYLQKISENLIGEEVDENQTDNYYLKIITEHITGVKCKGYHKNIYYLKRIAENLTGNIVENQSENYYLQLICENWDDDKTILIPFIRDVYCINDDQSVKFAVNIGSNFDGVHVDLHINNNVTPYIITNGKINVNIQKETLLPENNCAFYVNNPGYHGESNQFKIINGVIINITEQEIVIQ